MTRHLKEYDSLRGLAAVIIIITHFLGSISRIYDLPAGMQETWWIWLLRHTPLGIITAGNEGVPFFFILSGFVLSLSFFDPSRPNPYLPYLVKRFFRLYPVFLATISAMALIKLCFAPRSEILGFTPFFNHLWTATFDGKIFEQHLPLITNFKHARLNPPIWTLIIEMRISILFPLLVWLFLKFRNRALLISLAVSLWCGFELAQLHDTKSHNVWAIAITETLQWAGCFMAGIWLAHARGGWLPAVSAMNRTTKHALLCVGIMLYTSDLWFMQNRLAGASASWLYHSWFFNYTISAGACIFMVLALASGSASRLLTHPVVHFLGKISYSLYLWHMVLICALAAALHAWLPAWAIACLAFGATVAVSALSYHLLEIPFIRWGRTVADALSKRLGIPALLPKTQMPANTPP